MPDQRCKQIFAMLSDYLNAELPVKNCRELDRHLQGCEPCIAYLESLKKTVEACHRYQVGRIPAPSKKVREALRTALKRNGQRKEAAKLQREEELIARTRHHARGKK